LQDILSACPGQAQRPLPDGALKIVATGEKEDAAA
jgi:hypothetical protein